MGIPAVSFRNTGEGSALRPPLVGLLPYEDPSRSVDLWRLTVVVSLLLTAARHSRTPNCWQMSLSPPLARPPSMVVTDAGKMCRYQGEQLFREGGVSQKVIASGVDTRSRSLRPFISAPPLEMNGVSSTLTFM
eukprot:CAMPEP_0194315338 /NCGR_PEP_ID=MMETSP0171-20130528/12140_1 /TAXON_ID=218684 /ORGANISM="Corethron pennatum, Strain L29A3" /LENGTH=132 /DNA_ID=CAMNT_0039071109 /DNA_START=167 /DNA_END=562 /DNA_ORIENTATION=-